MGDWKVGIPILAKIRTYFLGAESLKKKQTWSLNFVFYTGGHFDALLMMWL